MDVGSFLFYVFIFGIVDEINFQVVGIVFMKGGIFVVKMG